ncbi:MAG: Mur ligase family protein [bacterium]|nr:Mur ligase family protein [bacterium]
MLKTLPKIFKAIYPFSDFLYILQLEEYDTKRYFKRLKYFFFRRALQRRGTLLYTTRTKITLLLAAPLGLISPPLVPIWIGVSNSALSPFFDFFKYILQKRAAKYFKQKNKKTKVIAIAGSYGKTTVKNYIYELIKYNYKTQMVPGNINTPTGIANWILSDFNSDSEIVIVEVDSYYAGEIKKSLAITPPDIAILTNIDDQHLERFRTRKNLREALTEVFKNAKKEAVKIKNKKTNLDYALEAARVLKIPSDIVKHTVKNLAVPERRGNQIQINGFEVIDNSYNISLTTAKVEILNAKGRAEKNKKHLLVITAGIPELGEENKNGNIILGGILDKNANVVFLLQSILHSDVEAGIKNKKKIVHAKSMKDALNKLTDFNPEKYLVLMQPELNDLYYSA